MVNFLEEDQNSNGTEHSLRSQGLEELSDNVVHDEGSVEVNIINGNEDLLNYDMKSMSVEVASKFRFRDRELAFEFYKQYGMMKGFAARKNKILRNIKGEVVQQSFVCFRQGFRKAVPEESRKRKKRGDWRCGCLANFRVHVDIGSGCWYVTKLDDVHNHELLTEKHCGMLALHTRLTDGDVTQLNGMRTSGIGVTAVYNQIANQSGGFDKVPFTKRKLYNQIAKQRRQLKSDVEGAIDYLKVMRKKDPFMYWRHQADDNGKLQHLFWCDGISQKNYEVFGDVVAFDATYGKNKYRYPFVMFSGVNNHNQPLSLEAQ